ncbi:MAG: tryptophan halogenase family protein [Sphingomicrobium sp.]
MTPTRRIGSIVVAGSGIVGLSAALAFARTLPRARVRLLSLPSEPAAITDRMPCVLPSIRFFHRLIGLEETRLVRQAGATHRLGTRFEQWSASGEPWYHCFGRYGASIGASPFRHQWARMRAEGRALSFDHYAPVTAAARADKFVHPPDDPNSLLTSFDYGLRFDPTLYADVLMTEAIRARVEVISGTIGEVVRTEEGLVDKIVLTDGHSLGADLFIDCAGPDAPILSVVSPEFEDWSTSLPCDRLLLASSSGGTPSPVDVAVATAFGWRMAIPMKSGRISCAAYCSGLSEDGTVERQFVADAAVEAVERVAIRPGRRESWVGNVVGFGDSTVVFDPLEGANLSTAQSAIRRAVSLLPDADFLPALLGEFNRQTRLEAERVRDFIAVHYLASTRTQGEYWSAMAGRQAPASLRHTLDQFLSRGRLPKYDQETFDDDSWLAVLFGLGLMPERIDPTTYRISQVEAVAMMERVERMSADLPAQLPAYADYLAGLVSG